MVLHFGHCSSLVRCFAFLLYIMQCIMVSHRIYIIISLKEISSKSKGPYMLRYILQWIQLLIIFCRDGILESCNQSFTKTIVVNVFIEVETTSSFFKCFTIELSARFLFEHEELVAMYTTTRWWRRRSIFCNIIVLLLEHRIRNIS